MSEELKNAVQLAMNYGSTELCKPSNINYDGVVSTLERVITAIELENECGEIEWADKIINEFDEIIKKIESEQALPQLPRGPGQPRIELPMEKVEELIELRLSLKSIAAIFKVSVITVKRRLKENNIYVRYFAS